MNKTEIICTACPVGCRLTVTDEGKIKISGNSCPKGEKYGISEYTAPVRAVSTLVRVKGGERQVISVRTDKPILKKDIPVVLELSKQIIVSAPVHRGDIIVSNITENANLIATADCGLAHRE